jgi:hypothetical protein
MAAGVHHDARDRRRDRLGDDRGITVVEVVIAAMILMISGLALLGLTDTASRNTYRAEQSQVVANRLQSELERIRQLPFSEVALETPPPTSSDPDLPANRVSGTQFGVDRDGTALAPLAINGGTTPGGETISGGEIVSGPEEFRSGDVSGQIYRYVIYPGVPADCTGCNADDLKRVVVAVALDDTPAGGEHVYQEIQSDIANPDAVPPDNELPPPPNGGDPHSATFFLTDTPCSQTERQPITGDHQTHNTRGMSCSGVASFGDNPGPPDLMVTDPAPVPDSGAEPFRDYATDVEPSQTQVPDVGLTLREGSANGCLLDTPTLGLDRTLDFLTGESAKHEKMHMWLSNELSNDFALLTEATADLNLWTRTVNGQPYSGKICVWVFKRVTVQIPLVGTVVVDVPAINIQPPLVDVEHFEYQQAFWPQEWGELRIPMRFIWATDALTSLGGTILNQRLGLAVTVERGLTAGGGLSGSGASGLEFMYDHRERDSRLVIHSQQDLILGG